jgi:hypothetical protein
MADRVGVCRVILAKFLGPVLHDVFWDILYSLCINGNMEYIATERNVSGKMHGS